MTATQGVVNIHQMMEKAYRCRLSTLANVFMILEQRSHIAKRYVEKYGEVHTPEIRQALEGQVAQCNKMIIEELGIITID